MVLFLSFLFMPAYAVNDCFILIPGSHIYIRFFLFFFPISEQYQTSYSIRDNLLTIEIKINRKKIIKEPKTPPIFNTDLIFRIKDIPINKSGEFYLPLTIRCNQIVNFKYMHFKVYHAENILVINGAMHDLKIKQLAADYVEGKNNDLKFPIYFDLRLQLPDQLSHD